MAQSMVWVLLALAALAAAGIFLTVFFRARETRKKNERVQKEKQARAEKKMAGRRVRKLAENGPVGPVSPAGRAASLAPKTPQLNALHEKLAMASANSDVRLGQAAGAAFYSVLFEDAESEADAALAPSARAENRASRVEKARELGLLDTESASGEWGGIGQGGPFVPSYAMPEHANVFSSAEMGEDLFAHARPSHGAEKESENSAQGPRDFDFAPQEPMAFANPVGAPEPAQAHTTAEQEPQSDARTDSEAGTLLAPHVENRHELAHMGELLESPFAQVGEAQPADWGFGETLATPLEIEDGHLVRQHSSSAEIGETLAADASAEAKAPLAETPVDRSVAADSSQEAPTFAQASGEFLFSRAEAQETHKAEPVGAAATDWEQEFLSALAEGVSTDVAAHEITRPLPALSVPGAPMAPSEPAAEEEENSARPAPIEPPRSLKEAQETRKSRLDRSGNDGLSEELRDGSDELMDIAIRQQGRGDWWNEAAKKDPANGWSDEEEPVAPWTALVVDDSGVARAKVTRILKQMGCHVKDARDGQEAWEMMAHWKPDLLVSDIEMPRLNGLDLSRRVKNDLRLASVPIIVMTGHLNSHLDEFADAQINGFLPKPFEDKDLQDQAKFLLAAANA